MYKITFLYSSLFSLVVYPAIKMLKDAKNEAKVEYKVGEFVTAPKWLAEKGYHLTVFYNFKNAINFLKESAFFRHPGVEIWRCKTQKEVPLPFICDLQSICMGEIVLAPPLLKWPKGTKMFEKVKLTERMEIKL